MEGGGGEEGRRGGGERKTRNEKVTRNIKNNLKF